MLVWLRKIDAAAIVALVWPLIAIAPMFAHSGVPAFQHDWLWPAQHAQITNFMTSGFQAWRRDGTGGPPVYPTAWWPYLLAGIACLAAGVHGGLVLFVYGAIALAATGVRILARALGANHAAQIAAIAIIAGNPFVLNELQAGHLIMLWAYALLPWIAFTVCQPLTPMRVFTAGVLIGLAAAQQQFLLFGLTEAFCIIAWRDARHTYVIVPIALLAGVVCMPEWISAVDSTALRPLDALLPVPSWTMAQSGTPSDGARLIGYIGGYDRLLPAAVTAWLWILPIAAIAGVLRFSREAGAFACVTLAGWLAATGVRGPLGSLWSYGFTHVHALTVLRELYDATALTALGFGVLAALAVTRVKTPAFRWAAVVLVALPALYIAAGASRHLPWVSPDSGIVAGIERAAQRGGSDRILPLPLNAPLGYGDSRGGYSPLSIGVNAHPSAAGGVASSRLTYLARLLEQGDDRRAAALAARSDVGLALPVPDVSEAFERVAEPRLKPIAARFAGVRFRQTSRSEFDVQRVAVVPFSAAPGTLAGTYTGARDLHAVSGGRPLDIDALQTDASPAQSWARTALWPILPAWVFAEPFGIFTTRHAATLNIPAAYVAAGAAAGTVHGSTCARIAALDRHFALLRCASRPTLTGIAPLVVASAVAGGVPVVASPVQGAFGAVQIVHAGPSELVVRVRATAGSALVLRDSFDPGWACSIRGTRHVQVDGYANAWVLPADINETVTLRYRPATAFYVALALSTALVALFAISPAIALLRRSRIPAMQFTT